MQHLGASALVAGGVFTALAALAHLACIVMGGPAYRLMGAGERMARDADAGRAYPAVITALIAIMLLGWAAYAFSGAGVIGPLPLLQFALPAISAAFLLRAVGFPLLRPRFPGNSLRFWLVSSAVSLVLGTLYAVGSISIWA